MANDKDSTAGRFGGTARVAEGRWTLSRKDGFVVLEMTDLSGGKVKSVMNINEIQSLLIALTSTVSKSDIKPSPKTACSCDICWVCWKYGRDLQDNYSE